MSEQENKISSSVAYKAVSDLKKNINQLQAEKATLEKKLKDLDLKAGIRRKVVDGWKKRARTQIAVLGRLVGEKDKAFSEIINNMDDETYCGYCESEMSLAHYSDCPLKIAIQAVDLTPAHIKGKNDKNET